MIDLSYLLAGWCTIHALICFALAVLVFYGAWLVCQLRSEAEPLPPVVQAPPLPAPSWVEDDLRIARGHGRHRKQTEHGAGDAPRPTPTGGA